MARHEICLANQIRRANRPRAKSQMADRDRAGFLGVVNEISLGIEVRFFADDLDGVFVGSDRAVGAKPEEYGSEYIIRLDFEIVGIRAATIW